MSMSLRSHREKPPIRTGWTRRTCSAKCKAKVSELLQVTLAQAQSVGFSIGVLGKCIKSQPIARRSKSKAFPLLSREPGSTFSHLEVTFSIW